jgi:hypothetical protein
MSQIEQAAGDVRVRVYTDGSPMATYVTIRARNGEPHEIRGRIADLHDLRYCIDRVLAQLPRRPD